MRLRRHKWEKRIERARETGKIKARYVDEFCCEFLAVHPSSVYGEVWFEGWVADEVEEEAAA